MSYNVELNVAVSGAEDAEQKLSMIKQNFLTLQQRATGVREASKGLDDETKKVVQGYKDLANIFGSVGNLTRQLSIGVWIMMSTQRRARESAWEVTDAEKKYNDALKEYGQGSEQARQAAENLNRARIREREAMTQNILTTGTWLANISLVILRIIAERAAVDAATGSVWGHVVALKALSLAKLAAYGPELAIVAGGLALGAGLAYGAYQYGRARAEQPTATRAATGGTVNINIDKVMLDPRGKTLPAYLQDLKANVKAARTETW